MIRDLLDDIFSPNSSFWERCLGAILVLLILIVVVLVVLLGLNLVDHAGIVSTKTTITVVEAKQIIPAHSKFILVGKVPVRRHYPESYQLNFKIDGEEVSPTVEKKFFDSLKVGDKIEVDYGLGRLSKLRLPTEIRLATK
ncbi:MAG TPA: hypothetical protein P5080_05635 [Candidatus Paceibacterota bacterium]|nr:hypothetical protein [Candidatus Pacearchaeota archaeon]HRZ51449.1 hypothetical protein [Candidatus Paceibacterota bacterium]HSA37150.1 hypothetical protein [Candidatus Paceibacterota bacterium]